MIRGAGDSLGACVPSAQAPSRLTGTIAHLDRWLFEARPTASAPVQEPTS